MTDAERIAAATDVLAKELGTDPEYATLEGCADALAHHHQLTTEELRTTRQRVRELKQRLIIEADAWETARLAFNCDDSRRGECVRRAKELRALAGKEENDAG